MAPSPIISAVVTPSEKKWISYSSSVGVIIAAVISGAAAISLAGILTYFLIHSKHKEAVKMNDLVS